MHVWHCTSFHFFCCLPFRSQWFTGYKLDMARNSCCSTFTHPSDLPDDNKSVIVERNKTCKFVVSD